MILNILHFRVILDVSSRIPRWQVSRGSFRWLPLFRFLRHSSLFIMMMNTSLLNHLFSTQACVWTSDELEWKLTSGVVKRGKFSWTSVWNQLTCDDTCSFLVSVHWPHFTWNTPLHYFSTSWLSGYNPHHRKESIASLDTFTWLLPIISHGLFGWQLKGRRHDEEKLPKSTKWLDAYFLRSTWLIWSSRAEKGDIL